MRTYILIFYCFCLGCNQKPHNKIPLKTNDSTITKNTKPTAAEPINDRPKLIEKKGILLGKINGKTIKYDRSRQKFSDGHEDSGYVVIYIQDRSKKTVLLDYNFDGYETGDVELIKLLNHPFICITEGARFGSNTHVYSVDLKLAKQISLVIITN